ncbi:MAG: hypothetical protein NTX64_00260 [Elusimicrobia bacterium]|nr:hypothetical protein [Elusimicrobiota bacterium]
MKFRHATYLFMPQPPSDLLLICSNLLKEVVTSNGKDFCGIVSLEGKIVFEFPIRQRVPDRLLRPIGFESDGKYAAVFLGERVEGEDSPGIGKPREILIWEFPATLNRHPGPWKNGEPKEPHAAIADVIQKYRLRPQK